MQHQILRANNKNIIKESWEILTIQLTPFRSGTRSFTTFSCEDIMCSSPADITAKALSRTYKMTSESLTMWGKQLSDGLSLHVQVAEGEKYCLIQVLLCRAQN